MTIYLICDDAAQGLPRLVSTKVFKGERTSMTAETAKSSTTASHTEHIIYARRRERTHSLLTTLALPYQEERQKNQAQQTADGKKDDGDGETTKTGYSNYSTGTNHSWEM